MLFTFLNQHQTFFPSDSILQKHNGALFYFIFFLRVNREAKEREREWNEGRRIRKRKEKRG